MLPSADGHGDAAREVLMVDVDVVELEVPAVEVEVIVPVDVVDAELKVEVTPSSLVTLIGGAGGL